MTNLKDIQARARIEPRALIRPRSDARVQSDAQREDLAETVRKVIKEHWTVLNALKDR